MADCSLSQDLFQIRTMNPIIHNITNFVVMEFTANALLAVGASPIMAHAADEVADIVKIANALVLNIGTLDKAWIDSMHQALDAAKEANIPVILDPVGAGATPLRTHTTLSLLQSGGITILRGNAAEIMATAGVTIKSKGVDSQYQTDAAQEAMETLCDRYGCIVVVSGEEDIITNNNTTITVSNGDPMMTKVTGGGCVATALIGAFSAVNADPLLAATHAMAMMGIAGEIAGDASRGPGRFKTHFIDTLYCMTPETIAAKQKINALELV